MMRRWYLILFSIWVFTPIAELRADDWQVIQTACEDHGRASLAKIAGCLALIQDGKISRPYFSNVYETVAFAYSEHDDYSQAIYYNRKGIAVASDYMKERLALRTLSPLERGGLSKAMSRRYWHLGKFYALVRLKNTEQNSDEARRYAKDELQSYSSAISFNVENHLAFMDKAKIESQFCDVTAAAADEATAMRIAQRVEDERAIRDYKFSILPACEPTWRGK
jgi:hypothetical protein